MINAVWSSDWNPEPNTHVPETPVLSDTSSPDADQPDFTSRILILGGLHFLTIEDREATIHRSYPDTFKWVLEESPPLTDTDHQASSSPAWLRSQNREIYWITGKPGSGTSTLTKFVLVHPTLAENLSRWSGNLPYIMATYYTWDSGI